MLNDPNYIFGDQDVQVPAHLNFGKFILSRLRKHSEKVALVNTHDGTSLSYKEITKFAVDLSFALRELGVKNGETVALCSEKRKKFIPTVLAIVFTGATYTPIESKSGKANLRHKLGITKPKFLICSSKFWKTFQDTIKSLDFIKTTITLDDEPVHGIPLAKLLNKHIENDLFEPAKVNGESDIAFLMYSSGTTGMPKGVKLTHKNCILNSLPGKYTDESLQVAWIKANWYHNYDTFITFQYLVLGRVLIYHPEFTNDILLKNINDYKVNIAFLVPSMLAFLAKSDNLEKYNLDSVKIIYSRSAPLHAKTIEQVKQRLPKLKNILQGYGMTEAGELTSESWGIKGLKIGSVGYPSPGITMKVVDRESRKTLGPYQHGEICLRGPVLMDGYIEIDPNTYLDQDGFFKTGDLGYYDEDNYCFIVERIKEIISYIGCEVPPLELETILMLHPGVREAGVVGKPDPEMGELPTAFVVRQPGFHVTEEELMDFVALEVADYMKLRGGVRFIDKIPRNEQGKILRNELRKMLTNKDEVKLSY